MSAVEDRRDVQPPLADGRCDLEPPLSGFKWGALYAQCFGADPLVLLGGAVGDPRRIPDCQGEDGRPGPAEFISPVVFTYDKEDASSRPGLDRGDRARECCVALEVGPSSAEEIDAVGVVILKEDLAPGGGGVHDDVL